MNLKFIAAILILFAMLPCSLSGCAQNAADTNQYNPALGNGRTPPPDVIAAQKRKIAAMTTHGSPPPNGQAN